MKKIVLFGDSIFNGFQADKKASPYNAFTSGHNTDLITNSVQKRVGNKAKVINLSQNGITVIEGLDNVNKVPKDADIIVIELGVNDAAQWGISSKMYQDGLTTIIKKLGPERCIILGPSNPNPMNRHINIFFDEIKLQQNNQAARDIAKKYDVPFIDWYKTIRNVKNPEEYYQIDGLHFTDKGYKLLVDTFMPAVLAKLNK